VNGTPADVLTILKEYGPAGMLAWLFWWTLRRMAGSHDVTVRNLKEQLASQMEATRQTSERFSEVVENRMGHVSEAVARFEVSLTHQLESQRQVSNLLLDVLNRIDDRLAREVGT